MSQISVNDISSLDGKSGPVISGITTVSSTGYMMVPAGPTEYRGGRGRGVFGGGLNNTPTFNTNKTEIDYITIATLGNALDFGDLSTARYAIGSCSSSIRGLFSGGTTVPAFLSLNTIDYVTISSTGNAFDFGDLIKASAWFSGCSSSTRGVFAGGVVSPGASADAHNFIQYVTIASLGNSVYFGDLTLVKQQSGACSSPTRGIWGGGITVTSPTTPATNVIDYITIATTGNSLDFGDLTITRGRNGSCSNSTRGLFFGGDTNPSSPTITNVIDYITIASTGDAIDFGDLSGTRYDVAGASSPVRGIMASSGDLANNPETIEYVTISTTGNTQDFGDLFATIRIRSGCSDSHGGLG